MKNLERQIGQISKKISVEKPSSSLPSDTIPNPKEECKVVQLRSGKMLVDGNQGATKNNDNESTKNDESINTPKPTNFTRLIEDYQSRAAHGETDEEPRIDNQEPRSLHEEPREANWPALQANCY